MFLFCFFFFPVSVQLSRMLHTKKRKPVDSKTFTGGSHREAQSESEDDADDLPGLERRKFTSIVKNIVQDFELQLVEAKKPKVKRLPTQDLLSFKGNEAAENVRLGRMKNPSASPSNIWNEVGTVEVAMVSITIPPPPAAAALPPSSPLSSLASLTKSVSNTTLASAFGGSGGSSAHQRGNSTASFLTTAASSDALPVPSSEPKTVVVAGTLNQLILHLTAPHEADGLVGAVFFQTFMVTLQTFTDPETFVAKMMERFECPPRPSDMAAEFYLKNFKQPVQMRVCNVLKKWIQMRFDQDFLTRPELIQLFFAFLDKIALDNDFYARNLRQCLQENVGSPPTSSSLFYFHRSLTYFTLLFCFALIVASREIGSLYSAGH